MPIRLGLVYDSGDYRKILDRAVELATGKAFPSAAVNPNAAENYAASAMPATSRRRPERPANTPRSMSGRTGMSMLRSAHCRAVRARDEFYAMRCAMAGGAAGTVRLIEGDTDIRSDRRRFAFRPLHAHGRRGDGQGLRIGSCESKTDRSAHAGDRHSRPDVREGVFTVRGTIGRSDCSNWRAPPANATACRRNCAARWRRIVTT